jgi:hypothetical protein
MKLEKQKGNKKRTRVKKVGNTPSLEEQAAL